MNNISGNERIFWATGKFSPDSAEEKISRGKGRYLPLFRETVDLMHKVNKDLRHRCLTFAIKAGTECALRREGEKVERCTVRERVHSVFQELKLKFIIVVMRVLFDLTKKNPKNEECDPKQRPILFIHGFGAHSSCWAYMRKAMKERGFRNIFFVNLQSSLVSSIAQHAERVERVAAKIREVTGRHDLDIVAHSMGGVVGRHFLYNGSGKSTVHTFVSLGSPLGGANKAKLGAPVIKVARSMVPGSKLLHNHTQSASQDKHTRYFHLAAENDITVRPWTSALEGGAQIFSSAILRSGGHVGMLFSKEVADWIAESLSPQV